MSSTKTAVKEKSSALAVTHNDSTQLDDDELIRRLNMIDLYNGYEWHEWVSIWNEENGREFSTKAPKNLDIMATFFAEKLNISIEDLPLPITKKNIMKFISEYFSELGSINANDKPVLLGFTSRNDRELRLLIEETVTITELLDIAADVWVYEGTVPIYTISANSKDGYLCIDMIWDGSDDGDENSTGDMDNNEDDDNEGDNNEDDEDDSDGEGDNEDDDSE